MSEDIIAAIATPRGQGGVAMIRISGRGAVSLLPALFSPAPSPLKMRFMYYGSLLEGKEKPETLDKGMAVAFAQGESFTGEETLELYCHGGERVALLVLEAALRAGARSALPGEFTKRAFLNGRIDLSEAEAVGDMIQAQSASAVRLASRALEGGLRDKIEGFRSTLTDMLASIEACIDYPDELPEQRTRAELIRDIDSLITQITALTDTYNRGRIRKNGLSVCLLGQPNAGKSTLLNRFCGRERAIVTPVPGTTRDILHETVEINGAAVNIYDTAGLRESADTVESIGIARAREQAENADLVLLVCDFSEKNEENAAQLCREAEKMQKNGTPFAVVYNKCDLGGSGISLPGAQCVFHLSALTGEGFEPLEQYLAQMAGSDDEGLDIASLRHMEALLAAREAISQAAQAARGDMPLDCISIDLHGAWERLGDITGQSVSQDIINRIFEKFCVGK